MMSGTEMSVGVEIVFEVEMRMMLVRLRMWRRMMVSMFWSEI